jgi:hypothetical protein
MKFGWLAATIAALIFAGVTAANAQSAYPWPAPASGYYDSAVVIDYGQVVGQDPDPFVRSQIQRDNPTRSGGNS